MIKRILVAAVGALICLGAHAQIVGATNNHASGGGSGSWDYSGWQASADGFCTIGPVWFLAAGAEVHFGKRLPSGLYLGGQLGGGWSEMEDMTLYHYVQWAYYGDSGHYYYETGSAYAGGAFIPVRADIAYYFGDRRAQPYVRFAPGLFFITGSPYVAAFDFQTGPGLLFGLTRRISVHAEVAFDFCVAGSHGTEYHYGYGYSDSNLVPYEEGGVHSVRIAPAVKAGLSYHF